MNVALLNAHFGDSMNSKQYMDLAVDKKRQGRFNEAKDAYLKALELDPDNGPQIWYSLGKIYYLCNEQDKAIEHYLAVIRLNLMISLNNANKYDDAKYSNALKMCKTALRADYVDRIYSINKKAIFLFEDLDALRYLAHAFYDLSDNCSIDKHTIAVYRDSISGKGGQESNSDMSRYVDMGVNLAIELIKWDKLV